MTFAGPLFTLILFTSLVCLHCGDTRNDKTENDLEFVADNVHDLNSKDVLNTTASNTTEQFNLTMLNITENETHSTNHLLATNQTIVAINVSQVAVNGSAVVAESRPLDTNSTSLVTNSSDVLRKSVNRRSADKADHYIGYYSNDGKYHNCTDPTPLNASQHNPIGHSKPIPLHKCQRFDETDLKTMFSAQVLFANNSDGIFGYYMDRKFHNCTPPRQLYDHPTRDDIKYIPYDLKYDPKCDYFQSNPGQAFDYSEEKARMARSGSDQLWSAANPITIVLMSAIAFWSII